MIVATCCLATACCGPAWPTPGGLPALGWVMLAVAALLLAEAVTVAWRFRREPPLIWRRKLVLVPAVLAVPAVVLAFQVWNLYGQYVAAYGSQFSLVAALSTSSADSSLDHAISGAAWLCGMVIVVALALLTVGAYQLLAAD